SYPDPNDEVTVESAVLGDFELLGELGRGSMGIVYKARQRSLRRFVALKVLPPSMHADPVARKRFAREIAALARCDHPNVVKILASGEDNQRLYYAMEYVEGADLGRAFKVLSSWRKDKSGTILREGHLEAAISQPGHEDGDDGLPAVAKIPPPPVLAGRELALRLVELFADAALGLAHLHAAGVIHRDLKPSNLMLTSDGKRIVIMDLGLAKLADESRALTSADIKILGTLRYMAPEQLQRRLLDVDERVDIYSLGAALYELISGRVLFDGDTEQRLIVQVLHDDPMPLRRIDPRISPDLAVVLAVAMAKNAAQRYPNATALAEDLRAVAEHRPILARPPNFLRRFSLWARRSNAGRTMVVTALLLLFLLPPAVLGVRSAMAPRLCAPDDLADCTKQCERNHAGSCFALGMMYANGAGIPRDDVRGTVYFKLACDHGHMIACHTLGQMREKGKGGAVDFAEAARLYTLSCNGGDAQSCNAIARMYDDGMGMPKDDVRAAEFFRKSCDRGYSTGCANLGNSFQQGLGVPVNVSEARKLYEKGCDGGSVAACGNLGSLYMDGIDVKQDDERAASLYRKACDGGYGFGCAGLGMLQEQGRTMPKDDAQAAALYKRGCDMADVGSCANLGLMVLDGRGVTKDEGRARVLFQQACEGKHSLGCMEFGRMLEEGRTVPKDERRAAKLFDRACKDKRMRACTLLAQMREDGRGVDKDVELAKALRRQACDGGDPMGCEPSTNAPVFVEAPRGNLPGRPAPRATPPTVPAPRGFPMENRR
ncbi:MAG TPA: serine/threonine-protein kinase, partial [Polyangium sp.]|nr:serine/threonine-protein kinase [Polyangium sp.]